MNSFEALCVLASKEDWCWRLSCTTCGQGYLKCGFLAISQGASPEDEDWIIHNGSYSELMEIEKYRSPLNGNCNLSLEEVEELVRICSEADLSDIAKLCKPSDWRESFGKDSDWRGYLGVLIRVLSIPKYEAALRRLSQSWARQLANRLDDRSHIKERLDEIVKNEGILKVEDLKYCY